VLAVDPNGSPRDFGDEPILIAKRLTCPVIVGESRFAAGAFAEENFGPQLHILDDGFQHRALARDFDVVLVSAEDARDELLPAGRLREPLSSLRRANAIVLPAREDATALRLEKQPIWRIRRGVSVASVPASPIAFCGIARPQPFIDQLRDAGITPAATKFYRDHHTYSEEDVRDLNALCKKNGANGFITTEKDAINLGLLLPSLGQVAVARVVMELLNPADALDTILRVIGERGPQP
jgi:tetraacyldisaccharide 4'-kinase